MRGELAYDASDELVVGRVGGMLTFFTQDAGALGLPFLAGIYAGAQFEEGAEGSGFVALVVEPLHCLSTSEARIATHSDKGNFGPELSETYHNVGLEVEPSLVTAPVGFAGYVGPAFLWTMAQR